MSELLREKRLREAKARRLEQRRLLLAPRLLLPPSVVLQQAPLPLGQPASGSQARGQLGLPSSTQAGPLQVSPATAPAPPLPSAGSSSGKSLQGGAGGSRGPGLRSESPGGPSRPEDCLPERSRGAPEVAGCTPPALPLPGAAARPPLHGPSGNPTLLAPPPTQAFCALPPLGSLQSPAPLLPTLVAPKQILPLTWVLTPQGFIPLALVSVPPQGQPPCAAEARNAVPGRAPPGAQLPVASAGSPQQEGAPRPPGPSPAGSAELPSGPPAASPPPALGQPQPPAQDSPSPRPALPQEEKVAPDYSLLSLEGGALVKEWAQGSSPAGGASLPRLPPFLCSLRTLSALLLNKEALERSAASLAEPEQRDTLRAAVRRRLSGNPAYQLLRARFLAALTFPAALAALPPSRVLTTLSGGGRGAPSSDDSSLEEEEEEEEGPGGATAQPARAPGAEEAAAASRKQEVHAGPGGGGGIPPLPAGGWA